MFLLDFKGYGIVMHVHGMVGLVRLRPGSAIQLNVSVLQQVVRVKHHHCPIVVPASVLGIRDSVVIAGT